MRAHSLMPDIIARMAKMSGRSFRETMRGLGGMTYAESLTAFPSTWQDDERQLAVFCSAWVRAGRRTVLLPRETVEELAARPETAVDDPVFAPERYVGQCLEFACFQGSWFLALCRPGTGWIFMGNSVDGISQGALLELGQRALVAYLTPEVAVVQRAPRRSLSMKGRKQAKGAPSSRVSLETLVLAPDKLATLRAVRPPSDAPRGESAPRRAHTVREHYAVRWVRCPRPGEEVLGEKTRTAKRGETTYTYKMYAVHRKLKAHTRGQGEVSYEPRMSVIVAAS
jgi:hypothetical protein